jgi:gliding motility-associated-like protein
VGFVLNQDESILKDTPYITCNYSPLSPPISIPIQFKGGDEDPRYRFDCTDGTLYVTPSEKVVIYGEDSTQPILISEGIIGLKKEQIVLMGYEDGIVISHNLNDDGELSINIIQCGKTDIVIPMPGYLQPIIIPVTVKKKLLTAKAEDKEMEMGDPMPALTIKYQGFVYGENENNLLLPPKVYHDSITLPRSYRLWLKDGEAVNYEFDYQDGILTVKPGKNLPTAFIPNGGKFNNTIWPWPESGFKVQIFNRLGMMIYSGKNGWDGKYNGRNVDPGVYFYVATSPEGIVYKGIVEVIRSQK